MCNEFSKLWFLPPSPLCRKKHFKINTRKTWVIVARSKSHRLRHWISFLSTCFRPFFLFEFVSTLQCFVFPPAPPVPLVSPWLSVSVFLLVGFLVFIFLLLGAGIRRRVGHRTRGENKEDERVIACVIWSTNNEDWRNDRIVLRVIFLSLSPCSTFSDWNLQKEKMVPLFCFFCKTVGAFSLF